MTKSLERLATTIRRETLAELLSIGYGHFGGSLSIVEALAVLYGKHLNYDASNPAWDARDRFILSKGHAGPALYATLAVCGFFPSSELKTLNSNGTSLPSHPDRKLIPGVEMTTGSMGQGLSVAAGLAYGLRSQGSSSRVYAIVGDGELNEGQCWEALQFISHQCLTNLVVMIDDNKRQLDGTTASISNPLDFVAKLESFGLRAQRVNGHSTAEIDAALTQARDSDRPVGIVLDTVKAAGVEFLEGRDDNHHVRLDDDAKAAVAAIIAELDASLKAATNE